MDNPRPEKVAVVEEVKARLSDAEAAVLTDYRGINVPGMAALRIALREAGAEYQIYKNSLVRFAVRDLGLEIEEMLIGPTAIAFIRRDSEGDPVLVAKALRDFARTHPALEVKGGLLGERILTTEDVAALARVAPREELLARLAGGLAAPMVQFAGLLKALPQNFAYGLKALIDQQGGVPEPEPESVAEEPAAEESVAEEPAAEEPVAEEPVAEEPAAEVDEPIEDATEETEAEPAEEPLAATDETEEDATAPTAEAPDTDNAEEEK